MHTPVLRYHGGKYRLAKWICSFFPEHRTYVEPFSGAASVLLRKPRSHGEVYNDLDQDVFNLFQVLRDPQLATRLFELCQLTPYSRDEFRLAYEPTTDQVERARRTIVRSAMGFGSGAATGHKTGFRCEAKRQHSTSAACWQKYPPVIKWVCARLQGVNIENRPALDCISNHDAPETLFYVDPPYLLDTRVIGSSGQVYRHEMTTEEHEALLQHLLNAQGMVVLSGYNSELYNDLLTGWRREDKAARISAGRGTAIKTECLWISPSAQAALEKSGGSTIRHTSRSAAAYVTHQLRAEGTESRIREAISQLQGDGQKATKAAVARLVGMSREQVSRSYKHLFI